MDVLTGYGMRKGHAVGMEHQAAGARRSVQVVANQGMALACQMHTDLVLAAGEQLDIDIRARGQATTALKTLEHLHARLRRLAAGADAHLAAVVTVAGDGLVDELFVPVDFAFGERQIVLFESVVDHHLVKGGLRLLVEREQHHAGGVAVQAVERLHVGRGKAVAHRQQQVAGVVGERALAGAVAVDDHAGGLVDGHEPGVAVEDLRFFVHV